MMTLEQCVIQVYLTDNAYYLYSVLHRHATRYVSFRMTETTIKFCLR